MINEACTAGSHCYLRHLPTLPGRPVVHQRSSIRSAGASAQLWLYGLYGKLTGCDCGGPGLASLAQAPCRYTVILKVIFLKSCHFSGPYAAQVHLTDFLLRTICV